jgi:acyl carrier protein
MDQPSPSPSTLDIVIAIVSDLSDYPVSSITADSNLVTELGLDSMDLVQMAMTIESTFSLPPIDYDPKRMETVRDVVKFIEIELKLKQVSSSV